MRTKLNLTKKLGYQISNYTNSLQKPKLGPVDGFFFFLT